MELDRLSADELRDFVRSSLDLMAIASPQRLIAVNPAWQQLLGWTEDELTQRDLESFVHPDDHDMCRMQMRDLLAGIPSQDFQCRFRTKAGDYCVLRWSIAVSGEHVVMNARDVTDVNEATERAERSEAMASAILHTAVDPIIVIDTLGTIIDANAATARLFGYALAELRGANVRVLMPEPYRGEHDGYISRYLAEGDPRIIGTGREVEALRADGTVFPIALAVSEVITPGEHLFTGIIHDLTERNRQRDDLQAAFENLELRVLERTQDLERSLSELARSNRDLEQFAYVASHDLQAPLRNVRQGLELLDEHLAETVGSGFDDEARELRGLVVAAVERMEDLIQGLLSYSRVGRNASADWEAVPLRDLLAEIVGDLSADLSDATVDIASDLPVVLGNPTQLAQLFQNLLQNAARYRRPDHALRIEISTVPRSATITEIVVADNGIGIEPEHHTRVFELFRRAHSGYDGVGMGLAICQRIVEHHGGGIEIDSDGDSGTAVHFTLPLADVGS